MIFIGIDDTDMPDTPGTNKLAFHLAEQLAPRYETRWIVRHQLLEDPRVPCTNKNGCVSMQLAPRTATPPNALIAELRETIVAWSPAGSDPGLCVAASPPASVLRWGRAAQAELLHMEAALRLAAEEGLHLEPLGGTGGGVIGALAAVGLLATWNSGRVVFCGNFLAGASDQIGVHPAADVYAWGVDDILSIDDHSRIANGTIDLGKRLRPNLRNGRVVLYVAPNTGANTGNSDATWLAQRIVA
jgi:hypothetical protein